MNSEISHHIERSIKESIATLSFLLSPHSTLFIQNVASLLAKTFHEGNKLLIAGNGGSLCDGVHFAEELTGYFREKRPALPAIVLSEPGHITCVSNDFGFDSIFARGIEAFGKPGDVFLGLSTSGNSPNIILAMEEARQRNLHTIALLGKNGGQLNGQADHQLIIPHHRASDRIQEAHMTVLHIIVETIERLLFYTDSLQDEPENLKTSFIKS